MKNRLRILLAFVFLLGATSVVSAQEVRLRARLAGAPINGITPKRVADSRARSDGSRLKIQVEGVNLPGATLNVLIDGVLVGHMTINAALTGELQLNTNDSQTVPVVGRGSTVVVTNQAGGTIVGGTF